MKNLLKNKTLLYCLILTAFFVVGLSANQTTQVKGIHTKNSAKHLFKPTATPTPIFLKITKPQYYEELPTPTPPINTGGTNQTQESATQTNNSTNMPPAHDPTPAPQQPSATPTPTPMQEIIMPTPSTETPCSYKEDCLEPVDPNPKGDLCAPKPPRPDMMVCL